VLSAVASIIASKSKFLGSICANDNQLHMKENLAEKLKYHLSKLSQYDHGINILITHAHRFRETGFRVHWINPRPDIEEPVLILAHYVMVTQNNLNPNSPSTSAQILATVAEKLGWNPVVHPCLHAEICIILYFLQKALFVGQYYYYHRATANRMPEETKLLQLRFGSSLNSRNHENPFRNIKIRTSGLKAYVLVENLLYDSLLAIYVL